MCEKPLATTSGESAELVKIAAECGRAAGVAYNIRFYPLCHEAAQRLARGDYGGVLTVQGSYVQDWLLLPTDFNWRVLADEGGDLRALADIGTHWLDLVQFITGQTIVAVFADLHTIHATRYRPPQGSIETFRVAGVRADNGVAGVRAANPGKATSTAVGGSADHSHPELSHPEDSHPEDSHPVPITTDDGGAVLLRFASGARGVLWVSQTTAGRKNCCRFEIGCAAGALAWNSESPNQLWIGHRGGANEQLIRDPALLAPAAREIASYPGGHNEGFPDTFKQLFRTFYGSIAAGDFATSDKFPTFADGHREIVLCEAILASHRQQRWVEIRSDGESPFTC
jgi:predicted dehydrogenase